MIIKKTPFVFLQNSHLLCSFACLSLTHSPSVCRTVTAFRNPEGAYIALIHLQCPSQLLSTPTEQHDEQLYQPRAFLPATSSSFHQSGGCTILSTNTSLPSRFKTQEPGQAVKPSTGCAELLCSRQQREANRTHSSPGPAAVAIHCQILAVCMNRKGKPSKA